MQIKEEIAKNLAFYRKRKKMTQKDLAELLGVKHNAVSSWENATNSIDVEVLFKICNILEINVNEIYGVVSDSYLKEDEHKLLNDYRSLTVQGKEYIRQTMDLVIFKYSNENTSLLSSLGTTDVLDDFG